MPIASRNLSTRDVAASWWPLAASWLFMALELPLVSAALARMSGPEVQLAAFGGLVYALMLLIESPVIMLLAASTALSRDRASYDAVRGYMVRMSVVLTTLHVLIVATPLYDLVAVRLIGAPEEIVGPARGALAVAIPWTWAIAYRRFNQGILIRHDASRAVGIGTLLRLSTTATMLWIAVVAAGRNPGIAPGAFLAAAAVITGVVAEAIYVGFRKEAVLRRHYPPADGDEPGIDLAAFWRFYLPLALTSLLALITQPLGAAALSRMPQPLASLATWPVVAGILFVLRSPGTAYKEVVVAMLDRPEARDALRRFTFLLALLSAGLALVAFTPLADLFLVRLGGLPPDLARLARGALMIGAPMPLIGVLQNRYVGALVHGHRTRAVTESMVGFLLVSTAVLAGGVAWAGAPGIHIAFVAFGLGHLTQMLWVRRAARDLP